MPLRYYHKDRSVPVKLHVFRHLLGGPLITFPEPDPTPVVTKPEPEKVPEKAPESVIDRVQLKKELIAEFLAEEKAKEEAEKAKKAEEIRKQEEIQKRREEYRASHHAEKERRKAARQARRDAITWTQAQSKKVVAMHKEGKSWVEIAKEIGTDYYPRDVERHYEAMMDLYAPPKEKEPEKKSEKEPEKQAEKEPEKDEKAAKDEAGKGKSNGKKKGKGKNQSDEEKVDAGKKAQEKNDQVNTRGGGWQSPGSFSKKEDNKINGMKKGNKSWKDIANALGKGRQPHEIKKRWKELNNDAASEASAPSKNDSSAGGDDFFDMFGGLGLSSEIGNSSQAPANKSKEEKPEEKKPEEKKEEKDEPRELKPDSFWSENDCKVLTLLLLKHHEQKLLKIQNGFLTLTGRMVSVQMLGAKLAEMDE